jgi:hypothetical protein
VQVTDAQSRTAQKMVTITVIPPPLEVVTTSLPVAQQGNAFSHQLSAIGGKPPYVWAVTSGALPGGLSVGSTTGIISGVPTAAGSFSFTVDVIDAESRAARKPLSVRVIPSPLLIKSTSSIEGLKGSPLSYQLNASGGMPPYTWLISSGALPAGVNLNPGTGLISGTPVASGTFAAGVAIRDQAAVSANATVEIKVIDPATIPLITRVKYKTGKKKLTVDVERADAATVLMINGSQMSGRLSDGQFVLKRLSLTAGRQEIRVVNINGVSSQPFILNID